MADYHTSFVKCWSDQFGVVVMVPISNVRSVTWPLAGDRAMVWLREAVPVGLNDNALVLRLFYEGRKTAGLLVEAPT